MNNIVSQEMGYYDSQSIQSIEKAILAESVSFSTIEPIMGKFFIPATTPSLDTEEAKTKKSRGYTQTNYVDIVIPPHMLLMFMNPVIIPLNKIKHNPEKCSEEAEKQIHEYTNCEYIMGFKSNKFTIPKGTEFLVEFLGGVLELDKIAIIGIYSITTINGESSGGVNINSISSAKKKGALLK